MEGTLLSNDQIAFVYKQFLKEEVATKTFLDNEREKIGSMKAKGNSLQKEYLRTLVSNTLNNITADKEKQLDDFESGTSEPGKRFKMICQITKQLELPYYAITGADREEVIESFQTELNEIIERFTGLFGS